MRPGRARPIREDGEIPGGDWGSVARGAGKETAPTGGPAGQWEGARGVGPSVRRARRGLTGESGRTLAGGPGDAGLGRSTRALARLAPRSGPDQAEPRRPGPAEKKASGPAKRERERARLMGAGPRERVLDWAWEGGLGWVWVAVGLKADFFFGFFFLISILLLSKSNSNKV